MIGVRFIKTKVDSYASYHYFYKIVDFDIINPILSLMIVEENLYFNFK